MKHNLIRKIVVYLFFTVFFMGAIVKSSEAQTIEGPQTNGSVIVKGKIGDTGDKNILEGNSQPEQDKDSDKVQIVADVSLINKDKFPKTGEIKTNKTVLVGIFLIIVCIYMIVKNRQHIFFDKNNNRSTKNI
ncbi:LPXTG cell wall anchor domain-containing protein [Carnobacterium maltaromaticum]|uniref:LPXTG cell wall anchor domain-containing protein n=2 Tax=Carnobacterium maltaromaticum TaxID=2751 RepID=UPI0039AF8959